MVRVPPAGRVAPVRRRDLLSPAPRRRVGAAAPVALLLALTACGGVLDPETSAEGADGAGPAAACEPAPLEERAAAVLHVGLPEVTSADDPLVAEVVGLGVGGIFVNDGNIESEDQLAELTAGIKEQAAGRPLLLSTDEESGRVSDLRDLLGNTPSPRRLAANNDPAEMRAYAADLGREMAELGLDVNLAPLLDLDDGPSRGIIGDRAFSADPELASAYGLAFARGLEDAGVIPTVKHFPGHGRSSTDTHAGTDVVETPLEELRATDLLPFQDAVDQGVPVIMFNHLSYAALDPDLPASMSPKAYALLRDMRFDGVAMTDSIGMGSIYPRWDFPDAAVTAVAAGADVVLASGAVLATDPDAAVRMRDALVAAVEGGTLPEQRLDEAAARVVALAGGDPEAFACVAADAYVFTPDPATEPDRPTGSATATPSP